MWPLYIPDQSVTPPHVFLDVTLSSLILSVPIDTNQIVQWLLRYMTSLLKVVQ